MNFWIGIMFFCAGETCYFFKPGMVFQSQETCLVTMESALKSAKEAKATKAYANCMLVEVGKTT